MSAPQLPAPGGANSQASEPIHFHLSEDSRLALLDQWRAIKRYKLPILGLGLMTMLVAAAVAFALTPIYRSTATIMIESGKGKVVSIDDVYGSGAQAKEYFQSQVEILKSREVAVRAAAALKLWNHPEFDPRRPASGPNAWLKRLIGLEGKPVNWTDEMLAAASGQQLMHVTSVSPVRLSQLVKVSIESPDRILSTRIANGLAQAYIDADRDARFKVNQQAHSWLTTRLGELLAKLSESEKTLQKYREEQGLIDISGSTQTLLSQQVSNINARLADAKERRLRLASTYQEVARIANGDYSKVPVVVANNAVAQAINRELESEQRVATLQATMGIEHTTYKEAVANLEKARNYTRNLRESVAKSILSEYQSALATEQQLEASLTSVRGTVQHSNRQEFRLSVLEREVASNRQLYDLFMSRAKETDLTSDLQTAVGRIVDAAVPPTLPVRPAKMQIIATSGVLALLLGAIVVMLISKLDNTVKTSDEVEQRLQMPVLTTLPLLKQTGPSAARLFIEEPHSQHAEAIRTARTGVLLSSIDEESRLILVTSSLPGEGKTTLASNLALAHAQTRRTLLVDADMRKPQIGVRFGLAPNCKGLSNLIAGTASLSDCIYPVDGSALMVLPAGEPAPNPLELIHSKRFADVIAQLRTFADIIIMDSPPVEVVSDALVIGPYTNGTIFVVKSQETAFPLVRKGLNRLQRVGTKILGVVVNGMDFEASRYYGTKAYEAQDYYGVAPAKRISESRPTS